MERQEADERERKAAEEKARWEAEQRAKLESQMRAEAEAAERREAERRTKNDASQSAQAEKERLEADEKKRQRNEHVAKVEEERQRVVAELLGKAKADQEAKARAEAEAKRRALSDVEAKKVAAGKAEKEALTRQKIADRAAKKPLPKYVVPAAAVGLVALLMGAAGVLTLIPFSADKPAIEKLVSDRIHEKVTVGAIHVGLLPLPHISLNDVTIGDAEDIKIDTVTVPWDVFGGDPAKKAYKKVELDTVAIKQSAIARLPVWAAVQDANAQLSVDTLVLRNIRLTLNDVILDPFGGQISLAPDGSFIKANFAHVDQDRLKAEAAVHDGVLAVTFSARKWRAPLYDQLVLGELKFKGVAKPGVFDASDIEAIVADGTIKGSGHLEWGDHWKLTSNLEIAGVDIEPLVPRFTKQTTLTGHLDGKIAINTQSNTMATLFAAPRVEGDFTLANGALGDVDLMAAIIAAPDFESVNSSLPTSFKNISGNFLLADQRYRLSNLNLTNEQLKATGTVEIAADSTIAGRVTLQLGTGSDPVKDDVQLSGTVKEPHMRKATK
jgi:hypothetical protein